MKKKFLKYFISIILPVVMLCTAGFYCAFSSFGASSASALSGNGGIVYVGNGSKFNMTNGSLGGGSATNGGGVYVASGGTFNLSGGEVVGNTATNVGNNIYNSGTFTMTGGTVGQNGSATSGFGIYNTDTMNLYGGTVYDDIYSTVSFNTKMACAIGGTINLNDSATITVQDYAGTTPTYNIELSNSRSSGTIVTFLGDNTTKPDVSKIIVSGYNSNYDLVIRKNSDGYFELALLFLELPSDWKTQVASSTYMTTTVTPANLTKIQFVATVPTGFTQIGTLSTGLPVYQGATATEIAFVGGKIYAPANCSSLFYNLTNLVTTNFSTFNTQNVTNMYRMFCYCSSLTSLDLSGFNTQNVTNMSYMFHNCSGLTSLDISGFNTQNVTNMSYMFRDCTNLTSLDVSGFDTQNVTNMSCLFYNCSSLPSLDVSGFNTQNVTLISGIFADCTSLTSLDVSGFNTQNVTSMSSMFESCSSLTSLDVSSFNTQNVTGMDWMFGNCSSLTSLDVSGFNTQNVTRMHFMFKGCSSLTSLDVSGFNTQNVTNMQSMFWGCTSLTSLDVSGFNTQNVTNMYYMFIDCTNLTSLDVSGFNTQNVTTMGYMFNGCSGLTSLDLSGFNTQNVTNMSYMFHNCSGLTSLDVSGFNTQKVTGMDGMFSGCSSLTSLDLSSFNMSKVTSSSNMLNFGSTNQISILKTPYNNRSALAITTGSTLYNQDTGEVVTTVPANTTSSLTYVKKIELPSDWKEQVASSTYMTTTVTPTNLTKIQFVATVPSGYTQIGTLSTGLPVYKGSTATEIAFVGEKIFAPAYSSWLFYELGNLVTINFSTFNTQNVTDMSGMFYRCSSLISLDLSGFDTQNVTDMHAMFSGCSSLTSLDLNGFNTQNVTEIWSMFEGCSSLISLDLSGFNTQNVINMGYMFNGCTGLTNLDVSGFNTQKVTYMGYMFSGCSSLTSLDLSSFDMSSVGDSTDMLNFGSTNQINILKTPYNNSSALAITTGSTLCNQDTGEVVTTVPANTTSSLTYVKKIDFPSDWKTQVGSSTYMTTTITPANLTKIQFVATVPTGYTQIGTLSTGLPVYQGEISTEIAFVCGMIFAPVNSNSLFYALGNLATINLKNFNTVKVTNMSGMFAGCSSLTGLNLSGFNTQNVTYMSGMFAGCSSLTGLNLSGFNTQNVEYMNSMFDGCSGLTSLDVSGFNTQNVTNMGNMFTCCSSLTSLDLSGFNTQKVTGMDGMFSGCSSLTSLDLSSFNMSKVTSSTDMLDFGSGNQINILKTPYNNSSALAITTGSTLYNVSTEAVATGVLAGSTSSQTLSIRFTLNLNANGGSCSTSSIVGYYGCSLSSLGKSLPTPTQSGYNFNGWYSPTGSRVTASTVLAFTSSTTLTARWTEITTPDPDPPTPPSPDPGQPSGSVNVDGIEYLIFTTTDNVPSGLNQSVGIDYNSRSAFVEMPSDPTIYANEDGTRVAFVGAPGTLIAPTDCSNLFAELECLKWVIFRNYDTFYSTNFSNMFQGCTSLEFVDMLSIQTPNVTAMDYMFQGCTVLNQIALAKFDCINLVSASYMFNGCINLGKNPVYSGTVSLGGVESVVIDSFPMLEYTYNLQDAQYMFADSNWPTFYMPHFFTDSLSNVTGMFENCNVDILDLSQFVCKNFDPSGIVGSGSLNPSAVYTPRYCRTSSFMSIFGRTYTLASGESVDIFDDLGYEGTIPFSLCFVDTDSDTIGPEVYQFTLVYNEWGFDELKRLISDMLDFSGISSFSGDVNNLTISTFSPLRDVYYLLPIPYGIDESTGEEAFAGWVGVSAGTTAGGGVPTDELFYNDFTGYNNFFGGSGHFMAVGWVDAMIDGPNYNNYGDVSSGVTPYTEWYNNQRNRLARVRYLPSCHGTDGQIFRGWYNENVGFISYYSNIAPLSDLGGPAWWEGMTVGFHDLGLVQQHDYWELPSGNSSFVSNASSQEKDLERMMNLYETNKQEILIPEDKKVTITELKLKKVS